MKDLRDALFEAVKKWDARGDVVGIISPTGTGKTLAGILAAVKEGRRVIYTLPFISIVEQTFDVANSIFPGKVLKFHHMTYPDDGDESKSPEDLLLMVESWDYPMVVTTFESLLSSLLSHKNADLKRLHSLCGSVVILDEVQAIPAEKWYVVKEALDVASKALDIHFIFMSATVPKLLTPSEVCDPLRGREPNRVRVSFENRTLSPEELAEELRENFKNSVMVELNTISSAERVADELVDHRIPVEFLSTHVTPYDRKLRIDRMKERLRRGDKFILVTTQVVEAGVDLDFPMVYRDLGPLDSIIQAAGRCNRNFYLEKGEVRVRRVKREGGRTDFSLVYGNLTEEVTLRVIRNEFEEKDFRGMLDQYYKELESTRDLTHHSEEVIRTVRDLDYDKMNFSLIAEEPKYSVLILESSEVRDSLEELSKALATTGYERRPLIRKWRAKVEEFTVKVWEEPKDLEFDEKLNLYISPRDKYHETKGFVVGENQELLLW